MSNENGNSNYRLNERLNRVETEMASVATKVESLQEDISGLITSFNNYVAHSNQSEKTDWANIAAWAGVFIACISGLLYHNSLTLTPLHLINMHHKEIIDRQQVEIDELKRASHIHASTDSSL